MADKIILPHWSVAPFDFPQGKEYLQDLHNIEFATTGLVNAMESNRFFDEACQMIVNAVRIFEMGMFDAAFYSLRQSIETSVGNLFLMVNPSKIKAWNALEKGFESGAMAKFLKEKEPTFSEMRLKMEPFFETIRQTQLKTNKYVHKQGYRTFYTCQKLAFPINDVAAVRKLIESDFEDALKVSIGAVAVYRLAIDPLPVLLMEETMMRRSMGFITDPFSESFVDKYIGRTNIEAYASTQIYKDYKECLLRNEEKNDGTLALAEWQFVDRNHAGEIHKQIHLLSFYDNLAFALFMSSDKIANIFVEGIYNYSSDVRSPNNGYTFGADYYDQFFTKTDFNVSYQQAFISRVLVNGKWSILEHLSPFNGDELARIKDVEHHYDEMYRKSLEAMKKWADTQGYDFREE